MLLHPSKFIDSKIFRLGNQVLRNLSAGVLYFSEKLFTVEILSTLIQWAVAIRHVKEHLAEAGISLSHPPSYKGVWNLLK